MLTDTRTTDRPAEQTTIAGLGAEPDVATWRAPPTEKPDGSPARILWGITVEEFDAVLDGRLTYDDAAKIAHRRVRAWRAAR
jgi:hypothetical protein